jgi:hypothetical protein
VQLAFVQLLLKLKTTRTLKFWEVTSTGAVGTGVDALLHTLTTTPSERVRKALTQLLLTSYFAYHLSNKEQLRRALSLIKKNSAAAKVFFANVHHFAPNRCVLHLSPLFLLLFFVVVSLNLCSFV